MRKMLIALGWGLGLIWGYGLWVGEWMIGFESCGLCFAGLEV